MGNFISKNHRIATAKSLSEGVGEEWYGFIASPEGTEAVKSIDEVSLDKLRRQILAHSPIGNNNFALMANYTPNNNDLIALTELSYYGQKTDDDGSDVVIDYTDTLTLKVFKVLYIGEVSGGDGTHIKISNFDTNLKEKDFLVYSQEDANTADGTINIKYKHIGTINSDERGNFYLKEENIFPVRFNISGNPDNTSPGGVENIQVVGDVEFTVANSEKDNNNDDFYPAILNGDGESGKVKVYVDSSGNVESVKVVDAGKYFKDDKKLKLTYTNGADVVVDTDINTRTNYFKFIISPT